MRPLLTTLASCLVLTLSSCGGSDPRAQTDAATAALARGDAKAALVHFERALAGIDEQHPEHFRAAFGRCEALARIDGVKAREEFLTLAKAQPAKVREDDYSLICDQLIKSGATLDAIDVMDAGSKRFQGSEKVKAMQEAVLIAAKREPTPEALKKMESLGYAGGGGG